MQAAFVFGFIVLGSFGYETYKGDTSSPQQGTEQLSQNNNLQRVEVTVQDQNTSQPIENVSVQIVFQGPPVKKMTDRNGYVELEIPTRDSVQLTLSHGDYKTTTEILNLQTSPNTTKVLYLDPVTP